MAKKATSSNPEIAAFRRELAKRKAELNEAAKKQASSGFLTDEEIIESLGLDENRTQYLTKVSRVRYGLDKHKSPYFAFNYTISQGEHEGTSVSQFFGLGGKTKAERAKKDERLCANFQRLGYDTTSWKGDVTDKFVESADEMTLNKPSVRLALYTWGDDNDRLGIDIIGVGKPSNKDEDEEASPPEDDQYEDADEVEEAEASEYEGDYESWIGYEGTLTTDEGDVSVTIESWSENDGVFTVLDENGDAYDAAPEDLSFDEE